MKSTNYVIITRNNRYTGYKHYLYTAEDDRGDYMEWTIDRNKATEIDRHFANRYVEEMNNFAEEKYTFDTEILTPPKQITDIIECCIHPRESIREDVDYDICIACGAVDNRDGYGFIYEVADPFNDNGWMD